MHHPKPSVDYAMFFSYLESREGEILTDANGNVKGRRFSILRAHPFSIALLTFTHLSGNTSTPSFQCYTN